VGITLAFDDGVRSESARQWLDWSLWSQCDRTCGNGLKSRVRNCSGGYPGDVGCQGASAESIHCTSDPCKDCPYSKWTFQSTDAPATQFLRSQANQEGRSIVNFSFCVHVTPHEYVKGTLGMYTNPGSMEPAVMIAGRGDALFDDYKLNVVLGQSIQTFVIEQEVQPGWICLTNTGDGATLVYNDESWSLDSDQLDTIELIGGGVLTAGLGFSGTLANLFLTSTPVDYTTLTVNETCFNPDDLIATLLPANLISNQGEPVFSERK